VAAFVGDAVVISAAKGLERRTLRRMTEVVREELPASAAARVCALSRPNLAPEVGAGKPAAAVIAGASTAAERARDLLMGPQFRCYTNQDVVGVEIGGALKNVIALGAGIGDGLAAGDNAKAAFLTRGIAEIARLGVAVGAEPLTFAGLTGLGDLVATCASPLSRNRRVGQELAKGRSLAEVLAGMSQVAEGVTTTEAARELGRRAGVELPITEQMHAVLFEGKSPLAAVADLMRRDAKDELEGLRAIPYLPGEENSRIR
ncbi:MAG: NAD(P)-dependent glycerol-3-phosphate dehydrogenase, partial [Chloroflexota bacterium]|nr:NAD(P)-dependent glycerol-3-phosphate dehydrogenase [Chloroflexota bacterium]